MLLLLIQWKKNAEQLVAILAALVSDDLAIGLYGDLIVLKTTQTHTHSV